jgi:hypothetical protein
MQDMRLNSRCFMNDLKVVKFMQLLQVRVGTLGSGVLCLQH